MPFANCPQQSPLSQRETAMPVVWLVIIGAAAGFLATRLMKMEAGVLPTIAIGIGGALIGGLVLRFLLTVTGLLAGLIGADLGLSDLSSLSACGDPCASAQGPCAPIALGSSAPWSYLRFESRRMLWDNSSMACGRQVGTTRSNPAENSFGPMRRGATGSRRMAVPDPRETAASRPRRIATTSTSAMPVRGRIAN